MNDPIRILTVCTHNRTRSVLIAGLLQAELDRRGVAAVISTAGFGEQGLPADPQTAAALLVRGSDTRTHSTTVFSTELANGADLIVAAERIHVVRVAEEHLDLFARTFTLPELVERAEAFGPRHGTELSQWLAGVAAGRSPSGYLMAFVPEVEDPTGLHPEVFRGVVAQIEQWCQRLAAVL